MKREEAIQYIDGLRCEEDFPYIDTIADFIKERNEAIDLAIEALSADTVSREFYEATIKVNHGLAKENIELKAQIESADRPTVVHCRECVRKKNCWMFNEHKDDNGTCVWAEPYYVTESQNDIVEQKNDVVAEQTDLISRADAIERFCEYGTSLERQGKTMITMVDAKYAFIKTLESLPSAEPKTDEWTPITESEPNTIDHVLVTYKWSDDDYEVSEMDYWVTKYGAEHGDKWCQDQMNHVIAWREKPKPYKEKR